MSEPSRATDPTPRSARIARAVARPAPGLATVVLCALALAFAGAQAILGPAGTPSPSQAQAHGKVVRVAAPACKPRRAARRSDRTTRKPRANKAARARCIRV
jgi:hypothetical protein